jgi:transcriptional regulator GlxA family with amidase domain
MHIAVLTFDGFNEIDSLVAFHILNRVKTAGWRVSIAGPGPQVQSMNGLVIHSQCSLEEGCAADAVIVGSGNRTRDYAADPAFLSRLQLDPGRQLIGSQCSGALLLARLGLLANIPVCTDNATKPWVQDAGVQVLNHPFYARGNIASAGGCLASQYLAAWIIARSAGLQAARDALQYSAPVAEKEAYVERAIANIAPYLN